MKNCKHCNSTKLTLSGIVKSKQRYRCKDCGKTSREGDKRIVHSLEKKRKEKSLNLILKELVLDQFLD